ncbi:DUF969 family protein [Campylobacter coli]|uniref:DUF969 family protein n=1 Tax=Campylobacter jejuni TaxID=197 RepID=A0A5Z4I2R3_CAMJU|nr:DUF969 family protein [Campylobacter coli]EAH6792449.1 DUF969 family protein [Campylobacter jejuni]EAH5016851.1 DUF969 family protein [Campylobacter coli]EAH7022932.1 DUF969 family protein [Campylobacter coli]EAH7276577.1 DUF969 family protein [Campylobacter coli]
MEWLLLASIPLIVLGFALKINPFLVVTLVGIYAGLVSGFDFVKVVSDIGKSFVDNRLIAPMAEAAAKLKFKNLTHKDSQKIKAFSAGTDNVAVFFGEDIFIAVHSILFIKAFYESNGIIVEPLHLSVWAIPTGISALIIHCSRLYLIKDRKKLIKG